MYPIFPIVSNIYTNNNFIIRGCIFIFKIPYFINNDHLITHKICFIILFFQINIFIFITNLQIKGNQDIKSEDLIGRQISSIQDLRFHLHYACLLAYYTIFKFEYINILINGSYIYIYIYIYITHVYIYYLC